MVWQPEIDEIRRRQELAEQPGRAQNNLSVWERIAALADHESFQAIGSLAGSTTYEGDKLVAFTPTHTVTGLCTLDRRKVVISAADSATHGEVPGTDVGYKTGYAQRLALEWRIPCIRLLDASAGSALEIERTGRTYPANTNIADEAVRLLSIVPVVSAVMGSVAGLAAVDVCLGHFSVMVKGTSHVFLNGPAEVKAALGCDISEEELGGWRVATSSGMVDNVAENEREACAIIRRFLSYLPGNVWEMPPRIEPKDDPNRRDEELLSVVPRDRKKLYNPYEILNHVLDHDSLFEISPFYGTACVTALGRVNGYPVGVMVKNCLSPSVGAIDVAAGSKMIRFLQLCDTFHLPIAYFADEPGFMVGREAQEQGIVRAGARLSLACIQTRMPWISFIVRQLYGVAGQLAFRPGSMFKHYGWASANWGGMHIEGGAMAAYRRVIETAPDPEAKRTEIEHFLWSISSPFRTAEAFEVEDIIDPRDTRPLLCDFVEAAQGVLRTQLGPSNGPIYLP
jgi:acetyl-CoA carboxylase carboxyltransferase component